MDLRHIRAERNGKRVRAKVWRRADAHKSRVSDAGLRSRVGGVGVVWRTRGARGDLA